jgi:hypothetical protein
LQAEDVHDLAALVGQRLAMAGLSMHSMALTPMAGSDYSEIFCRVSRNGRGCERAKRVNRMIHSWAISTGGARSDADGSQ